MKKAIKYLRSLNIKCDNKGNILSDLPDGEEGLCLIDYIEELTMKEDFCFTIINDKIEKIDY